MESDGGHGAWFAIENTTGVQLISPIDLLAEKWAAEEFVVVGTFAVSCAGSWARPARSTRIGGARDALDYGPNVAGQ